MRNLSRFPGVIVAFSLIAGIFAFIPPAQAQPQPTFVAVSVITATASPGADMTVALPAGYLAYDVFILQCMIRSVAETVTVSGWTAVTGSPFDRNTASRYWILWKRATSSSETAPVWDTDGSTADEYCQIAAYRNAVQTGTPIDVVGTATTGTADPAPVTTLTTLIANSLVVLALQGEDNNNNPGPGVATGTDPVAFVEHYTDTTTGTDAMSLFAEETRLTAGATGTVSYDFNVAVPVGWGAKVLSLAPVTPPANGFDSLISMSSVTKSATTGQCAAGGNRVFLNVSWGLDNGDGAGVARDGTLQAGEVDATNNMIWTACNGAAGATGAKGDKGDTGAAGIKSLIKVSIATVGQCTYGGWLFETGLDDGLPSGTPRNGILEAGEVEYSAAVCNGAPGAAGADGADGDDGTNGTNGANGTDGHNALINITDLSPGDPNCTWGGFHFQGGLDANNDTILQPSEVTNETNACNGAPGADGADGADGSSGPPGSDANVNALLYVIGAIVLGCIILAGCLKSTIGMLAFGLASLGLGLLMVGAGLPLIHWIIWIFAGLISCISSPLGE